MKPKKHELLESILRDPANITLGSIDTNDFKKQQRFLEAKEIEEQKILREKQRLEDERIAQVIFSMITNDISIFYISVRCKMSKWVEDSRPQADRPAGRPLLKRPSGRFRGSLPARHGTVGHSETGCNFRKSGPPLAICP
jgi:hypothetical protein